MNDEDVVNTEIDDLLIQSSAVFVMLLGFWTTRIVRGQDREAAPSLSDNLAADGRALLEG
jgi:hypothetical protein